MSARPDSIEAAIQHLVSAPGTVYLAVRFADGKGEIMNLAEFLAHDWIARPSVSAELVNIFEAAEKLVRGFDTGGAPVRIVDERRAAVPTK